jgi:hypothetical protein
VRFLVKSLTPPRRLWKWDDGRWKRRSLELNAPRDGWTRLDGADGRSRGLLQRSRCNVWGENRLGEGLGGHPAIGRLIDARRDDRHPNRLLESGINDRAHDPACGLVHFIQRQIFAARDRNQDARSSFQRGVVEQWSDDRQSRRSTHCDRVSR